MRLFWRRAVVFALIAGSGRISAAQEVRPDSIAIRVASAVRNQRPMFDGGIVGILGQDGKRRSQRELEAVADSLVAMVNSRDQLSVTRRRDILFQLGESGWASRTVPFGGAGAALYRVVEAEDPTVVGGAVGAIGGLANKSEALTLLSRIAESQNIGAATAVQTLFHGEGISDQGRQLLRSMWARGSVKEKDALLALDGYAQFAKWPPRNR